MTSVIVRSRCAHCRHVLQLECEGLPGFWGYETYNEYFCPHCRKQNHARTPGAISNVSLAMDDPEANRARPQGRTSPRGEQ